MDTRNLKTTVANQPFNQFVGLDVIAIGQGWSLVKLPENDVFATHMGTLQGAALFTVAEAASSACVAGLLGDDLDGTTLVTAGSSMTFRRPARGEMLARASLYEQPSVILHRLARDGATALAVTVSVRDRAGDEVARLESEWRLSKRLPTAPALGGGGSGKVAQLVA